MSDEMHSGVETPEVRTQRFFDQQFPDLADALVGMTIAVPGTQNRITVTATEPYARETNTKGVYKPVLTMTPGTLAAIDYPFRKSVLPLIAAKEGEESGACVRITGATISEQGKMTQVKKGRDILSRLGIEPNGSARLAFLDPSSTLFIVTGEENVSVGQQLSAGEELERAFDEIGK